MLIATTSYNYLNIDDYGFSFVKSWDKIVSTYKWILLHKKERTAHSVSIKLLHRQI